jgi:hypothetical protein
MSNPGASVFEVYPFGFQSEVWRRPRRAEGAQPAAPEIEALPVLVEDAQVPPFKAGR